MSKIVLSLCELVVGILLLVNPVGFTKGIITAFGVLLLIAGIISVIQYFREDPREAAIERKMTYGLLEIFGGLICVLKSGWFITAFPILTVLYGVITLVTGITKVQWTVDMLRMKLKKWPIAAISAAVTLVCAAVILANPFSSTVVLWTFIAVTLIIEAVIDIVALIFSKKNESTETIA